MIVGVVRSAMEYGKDYGVGYSSSSSPSSSSSSSSCFFSSSSSWGCLVLFLERSESLAFLNLAPVDNSSK